MKLFENYKTAADKYGRELAISMHNYGIHVDYLLAACRFYKESQPPKELLYKKFEEWKYLRLKDQGHDVNNMSYATFIDTIQQEKKKVSIPNVIYENDNIKFGELKSPQDVKSLPIKHIWCIENEYPFNKYVNEYNARFFAIYLLNEDFPLNIVIAQVLEGKVEYWDSENHRQLDSISSGDKDYTNYQEKLPNIVANYLNKIAKEQVLENETNQNREENNNEGGNTNDSDEKNAENKLVSDSLQRQYELMYELGCVSRELFENLLHNIKIMPHSSHPRR